MNIANRISLSRIVLAFLFVPVLLGSEDPSLSSRGEIFLLALGIVLFALAALTDIVDGAIARKKGIVTDLGKIIDPVADKILISTAFITLLGLRSIDLSAWMVAVIVARELAMAGLRIGAASQGKILTPSRAGQYKTGWQMAIIMAILAFLILLKFSWDTSIVETWGQWIISGLMWITVTVTIISGCIYFLQHKELFSDFGK